MSKNYVKKFLRNDPESPTLDPERDFIVPGKKFGLQDD